MHRVRVLGPDESDSAAIPSLIDPVHPKPPHSVSDPLSAAVWIDKRVVGVNCIMGEVELSAEVVNPG